MQLGQILVELPRVMESSLPRVTSEHRTSCSIFLMDVFFFCSL